MPAKPTEVAKNPIHLHMLPDVFIRKGLEVQSPRELLQQLGITKPSELVSALHPVHGAVQTAPQGVIQDPAGVAIEVGGDPKASGARGASGAIYSQFPDLKPIPPIQRGSAIFNSSTGPGRRVLHTYSPELKGSPESSKARQRALQDLTNAYANALEVFRERAADLGADGTLLNLVPVSGAIYSREFIDSKYNHLHPSYTICAMVLALAWWRRSGPVLPSLTIYFYDKPVYNAANGVVTTLAAAT
jgi:hypothetical protein